MAKEDDCFVEELAILFKATRQLMDGTAGPIEHLIEQGDVVYGVWLDKTNPAGIDFEVLKGIGFLEKCQTSGVRKTVVPCGSREQAIRIRTMFCAPESRSIWASGDMSAKLGLAKRLRSPD